MEQERAAALKLCLEKDRTEFRSGTTYVYLHGMAMKNRT